MKREQKIDVEKERLVLQQLLDAGKSSSERNRLGQFGTPTILARDILKYASSLLPTEKIKFLDPAVGTGAFYSALLDVFPKKRIAEARGYEIDEHYGKPAMKLWAKAGLDYRLSDFTRAEVDRRYNLIICNPPYVRHHHISGDEKARLQARTAEVSGSKIGGLAGLYAYFVGLSHTWAADGAISGWLIPSEFMDVNYGRALKHYLLHRVTLLRIHRFDPNDGQFDDALVSSAVVWFKNEPPARNRHVDFTFGGTLLEPSVTRRVASISLSEETKWTRFPVGDVRSYSDGPKLSDYFKISRGLATGDNKYFILAEADLKERGLPLECFRPILPGPRYVPEDEVRVDSRGIPLLERRLFLLDTRLPEETIKDRHPSLYAYLNEGKVRRMHEGYLCSRRNPWYSQENRPAPPIICTYLGRGDKKSGRPFRFILNPSKATVANVYLAMYPTALLSRALVDKPDLIRNVWQALNRISAETLLSEGRVYGGGLHKLEPRELANVPVPEIANIIPQANAQNDMFAPMAAE
jgi:adenine-specific DNA-methyltransferase